MPKQRSPNRNKAFEIYKKHNGNIDLVKIAELLNLSPGTIRGWKNKDKWDDKLNGTFQKKNAKNMERSKRKKENTNNEPELKEATEILNPELTEKQKLFVAEYLTDFNATRAYLKAYNCSYNAARVEGCKNLTKPNIQSELKKQTEAVFDNLGLTTQRILMEYMKIAGADIKNYLTFGQREVPVMTAYGPLKDEKGNVVMKTVNYVDFKDSSEVDGSLIQEVKQGKDGASIKLYDKQKALDTLAKYMKIIVGGVNINVQQNNINVTLDDE